MREETLSSTFLEFLLIAERTTVISQFIVTAYLPLRVSVDLTASRLTGSAQFPGTSDCAPWPCREEGQAISGNASAGSSEAAELGDCHSGAADAGELSGALRTTEVADFRGGSLREETAPGVVRIGRQECWLAKGWGSCPAMPASRLLRAQHRSATGGDLRCATVGPGAAACKRTCGSRWRAGPADVRRGL